MEGAGVCWHVPSPGRGEAAGAPQRESALQSSAAGGSAAPAVGNSLTAEGPGWGVQGASCLPRQCLPGAR